MIEKYLNSDELKRLLSTLVVSVGCLIIAALFASIVVPGLRNANTPATPTAVAPVMGETGWLDLTEDPIQRGRVIPPVDPRTLIEPSAALTDMGKKLYETNCLPCHGSLGRGDGPASNVDPQPRDFKTSEGWTNGSDISNVYKTLKDGIPRTSMTSYDNLTKRERMALVHYVQSLGEYPAREGNLDAMQALSEELAAPGEKTNNKIPVSLAIAKLESEYTFPSPLMVSAEDHSLGATILSRGVTDPARAAQSLTGSVVWRNGPDALALSVLPNVPGNGFSISLATLKPNEWQALYDELLKRINAK